MPKVEQKQVVINAIKEKLENSSSVVLVDARGLTVLQDTNLRKQLREAGVVYKVFKNSMMSFAFKDTEYEPLQEFLAGPTTIAVSYDDATLAARILSKNLKDMPNLEYKAGVVDGRFYDTAAVKALGEIPPKDELLAKLLGSFKSPLSKFARVIKAIADEQAGQGSATEEQPVEGSVAAEQPV